MFRKFEIGKMIWYKNIMNKQKMILILFFIMLNISFLVFLIDAQDQTQEIPAEAVINAGNDYAAGVPKNVLIELYINAGCTTCPKAAFCLEELAWSYEPGQVILVEAHIWGDGYDIPETNARYDWYVGEGKKGTPDAFFNGLSERIQGLCCDCGDIEENYAGYQRIIDKHLAETSPVEITAEQTICADKMIIQGNVANRSHSLLQNLMLSGVVYDEGEESELFYLVKDIFENQDICQLAPMEERNFSFISSLNLSEPGDDELDRLYSVIFIQDRLTKEVVQSFLIQ